MSDIPHPTDDQLKDLGIDPDWYHSQFLPVEPVEETPITVTDDQLQMLNIDIDWYRSMTGEQ